MHGSPASLVGNERTQRVLRGSIPLAVGYSLYSLAQPWQACLGLLDKSNKTQRRMAHGECKWHAQCTVRQCWEKVQKVHAVTLPATLLLGLHSVQYSVQYRACALGAPHAL